MVTRLVSARLSSSNPGGLVVGVGVGGGGGGLILKKENCPFSSRVRSNFSDSGSCYKELIKISAICLEYQRLNCKKSKSSPPISPIFPKTDMYAKSMMKLSRNLTDSDSF